MNRGNSYRLTLGGAVVVLVLGMTVPITAWSQACRNPASFTLCAFDHTTPAKANDVNANFNNLRSWVEAKIGSLSLTPLTTAGITNTGNISTTGDISASGSISASGNVSSGTGFMGVGGHGSGYVHFSHTSKTTAHNYALLQYNDGTTYLNASTGRNLYFRINNAANTMVLSNAGHVGIGIDNPSYPLHITTYGISGGVTYGYLSLTATGSNYPASDIYYSIWANHRIAAAEFNALSDGRVKNVLGETDTKNDLEIVSELSAVDYEYKDVVSRGKATKKGFVAQDVEKIFPQAVRESTGFIPNIYSLEEDIRYDESAGTLTVSLDKPHDCVEGDVVKVIVASGEKQLTVSRVVSKRRIVLVGLDEPTGTAFIFGKRVDDLRTVDYDAIFVLGIGAIQEQQKTIERLERRISQLER